MPEATRHVLSREGELARLREFIDGEGTPVCLVLFGEPGVGKTLLWEEGVALAEARRLTLLSARAAEAESGLSFAALGDLVEGITPEVFATLPGPHRRAIEVALRRADAGTTPPDPLAICVGFLGALRVLAAAGPVVVAVDDMRWLDASSADVIAFAARRVPNEVRFLLSRRPGQATELERALEPRGVERLELGGLSSGAIARLLSERLDLTPPRRVLRQICETSQGNPLFALELGRLVAERGPPDVGAELPLPHVVEDVFGGRVRSLGAGARRALLAVALSAGISRAELERIVDPVVLEDAEAAGLLVADRQHVRPSHALLAAAARHASSALERRELHRDLSTAVTDPILQARHLSEATVAPEAGLAAVVASAAGLAAERGGGQEAAELARHALRLTPHGTPERADRLLALARAYMEINDGRRAEELIMMNLEELPRGRVRARGLLVAARASTYDGELAKLELARIEAGGDPEIRADVLARQSLLLSIAGVERLAEAEALARQAQEAGLQAGPDVELRALSALVWNLVMQGKPIGALDSSRWAPAAGQREQALERPLGVAMAFRGEATQARQLFKTLADEAEKAGELWTVAALTIQLCELELRCGDVVRAEQLMDELGQWTGEDDAWVVRARVRALAAALRGETGEAVRWARKVLDAPVAAFRSVWDTLEVERALGVAALFVHDAGEAVARLSGIWEHTRRHHVHNPGAFPVAGDLVEALLLADDAAAAGDVVERLGRESEPSAHPWGMATAKRCAALLTLHAGPDEAALAALEEAATTFGALGLRFDRARCLLAVGRAQRRSKKSGAARRTLEQAAEELTGLGCVGWAEQARGELARISGRRQSGGEGLTPSEQRVAELAAGGLSNKEIAAKLFVSVYTVEEHLSNAYAKLGLRSRTQLAKALAPPE